MDGGFQKVNAKKKRILLSPSHQLLNNDYMSGAINSLLPLIFFTIMKDRYYPYVTDEKSDILRSNVPIVTQKW